MAIRTNFTTADARRVGEQIGIDWESAPFDAEATEEQEPDKADDKAPPEADDDQDDAEVTKIPPRRMPPLLAGDAAPRPIATPAPPS
jgi:hypothetical protein